MLDKYIVSLLNKNKRVIIPQIGAFILKKQGDIDVVNFNSILKFDDKKLEKEIIEAEGVDEKNAQNKLNSFIVSIQNALKKGDRYNIKEIGSIYQDANGRIQFLAGSEKPKTTTKQKTTPPPAPEKKEVQKQTPQEETQGKEQPVEEKKDTQKEVEEKPPAKTLYEKMQERNKTTTKTKTTYTPPPPPPKKVNTKKNNRTFLWVSLGVLVIAVGITIYLLMMDTPQKDNDLLSGLEEEAEMTIPAMTDTIYDKEDISEDKKTEIDEELSEKTEKEIPANTEKEITETSSVSGQKYFYVVAGCFQQKQNANNYLKKLQNEGYEAEKFGMIRNMHAISYSKHETREEALENLQKIRREREPNAWLIHY